MTNRTANLLRKVLDSLKRWEASMDYSDNDYTNDRVRWLEQEVENLKKELGQTRTSVGTGDGGFERIAPTR
jgi:tRNA U34 5-carboxymethylaminomethyl modifying GTPase MnmE/TrmE